MLEEGAMIEVCPFISMYFLIEKRHLSYCHMHIQVYWREGAEEEFHPLLFIPDPCSLAGTLRSCFRASGFLSICGSICQKEVIRLHGATDLSLVQEWTGAGETHIPVTQSACRTYFLCPPLGCCVLSV